MTDDFVNSPMSEPVRIRCNPTAAIPNNPDLDAVVYSKAIRLGTSAGDIKALYERNAWTRAWVYTLFDFHHYHYAAHEVLTVIAGIGRLQLGGETGPERLLSEGDVVILPAGYGHKLLDSERGFSVVGAYPRGQDDTGFHQADVAAAERAAGSVAATSLPASDPIYGSAGPLMGLWR